MNRSLKKYGKARWINTRLSRPHKVRQAVKTSCVAGIYAQGVAGMQAIIGGRGHPIAKQLALAQMMIDTQKVALARLQSEG